MALTASVRTRSGEPLLLVPAGCGVVGTVGWLLAFAAALPVGRRPGVAASAAVGAPR